MTRMLKDGLLVRKQYLETLSEISGDNSIVKVITGMRGVGKTTLMRQYVETYVTTHKLITRDYDFDSMDCFDMRSPEELRTRILKDCDGSGKTVIVLHRRSRAGHLSSRNSSNST